MLRLTAALLLAVSVLTAVDEAQVLAAARAASVEYQNRFDSLVAGLQAKDEQQRIDAVHTLGMLRDPRVVPVLVPWVLQPKRTSGEHSCGRTSCRLRVRAAKVQCSNTGLNYS